jgi:hypothetical protein
MNQTASIAAWTLHNLGLATSLGGSIYGRTALHPSLGTVPDPKDRAKLAHESWKRFNRLNLLGHLAFAIPWLVGRTRLSGREIDPTSRTLVRTKDALIAVSLASGLTAILAGERGIREPGTEQEPPMTATGMVSPEASARAKRAERLTMVAGVVNMAALAGIIGVTAALAMRSARSTKWSLVSRFLP